VQILSGNHGFFPIYGWRSQDTVAAPVGFRRRLGAELMELRGYWALAAIAMPLLVGIVVFVGRIALVILIGLDLWHLNREVADVVLLLALAVFRPGSLRVGSSD
jgi:hypothetical protein